MPFLLYLIHKSFEKNISLYFDVSVDSRNIFPGNILKCTFICIRLNITVLFYVYIVVLYDSMTFPAKKTAATGHCVVMLWYNMKRQYILYRLDSKLFKLLFS